MKSALRVSSNEPVTVPHWLEPIRSFFWYRASLMPSRHTDSYKRQWLTGARSLPVTEYIECLDKMFRRSGREAVAAAVNTWLVSFGLRALPLHVERPTKDVRAEVLEAFESSSKALNYVLDALRDNEVSASEKQRIRELIARAESEIQDVERLLA